MSALKQSELTTLEQYELLPEDSHIEVFEGIPYNMASPSQEHQTISVELSTIISKNKMVHAAFFVPLLM